MPKGVFKNPAARGRKIGKALRRGRYLHCEVCGEKFWRKPRDIKKGDCRFCSRACYFAWQRGKPKRMSEDGRKRFMESHSGERSSNWKGGITSHNKKLRDSPEYLKWRDDVFRRDKRTCQKCGKRYSDGPGVHLAAHHILPFATFPELRLSMSNGIVLCRECHSKEPKGKAVYNITVRQGRLFP